MKLIKDVLIMAAGRGIRMMPLTAEIPKPMAPFWGSTLIAGGIKRIEKNIKNVHVTVGYKGALLSEHLINLGVASIFNTDGHGNSWWIYNTLIRNLDKPIFVLTCDNLVDLEFDELEKEYLSYNEPACMVVPVKPVPDLKGDYIFHKNNLVTKLDRNEISEIYCSGVQILNPHKINQITTATEDFYNVWNQLIIKKEVYVSSIIPKRWFAVDTLEHLEQISKQMPWI